jgi:hypothetical protein
MTPPRSVRIPAPQAAAIVDSLLAAYARRVDGLAAAARSYRRTREPLAAVEEARREVIETEGALDAIGWERGPRRAEIELAGPPGEVRDVLYEALVAAADAARAACRAYERGRIDRVALAAAVADVTALHERFAALEDADAPDAS